MRQNFPYVGASYLFLIQDNQILLQRRFQTGFEDGNYGVPAGHLDGGETAREGGAREICEEIGIEVQPGDLQVVHVMHRKASNDERFDFFMTAPRTRGLLSITSHISVMICSFSHSIIYQKIWSIMFVSPF